MPADYSRRCVYVLTDPDTGRPRYVGSTACPLRVRLAGHLSSASGPNPHPVYGWIRELRARGLTPKIEPVLLTRGRATTSELQLARFLRRLFPDLLNVVKGDGFSESMGAGKPRYRPRGLRDLLAGVA